MAVRWEKQFGDSARFAIRIAFENDLMPDERQSEEMRASWGALALFVEGKNLTLNQGGRGEYADSVHWYLLPLLEWVVENWDPIFHEERFAITSQGFSAAEMLTNALDARIGDDRDDEASYLWFERRFEWWRRHSLLACREGGIFPNVSFRRFADSLEISWDHTGSTLPGSYRRFVEPRGVGLVLAQEAGREFYKFLRETVDFLGSEVPNSKILNRLKSEIKKLTSNQRLRDRYLWLGGFGSNGQAKRISLLIRRAALQQAGIEGWEAFLGQSPQENKLIAPQSVPMLLFRCATPNLSDEDLIEIRLALHSFYDWKAQTGKFFQVVSETPCTYYEPWRQGYDLALVAREVLKVEDGPISDMEEILRQWEVELKEIELSDQEIRAMSFVGPDYRPGVILNRRSRYGDKPWARKMDLAHELCHLLFDQAKGRPFGIISGRWAPESLEQRANAFAAMFLLPEPVLRSRLGPPGGSPLSSSQVRSVMSDFGTGAITTTWHLRNLRWIDDYEREILLDELKLTDGTNE